jgi:hypothetical protein
MLNVSTDLFIAYLGIERLEPGTKRLELVFGQLLYCFFDIFDCHGHFDKLHMSSWRF